MRELIKELPDRDIPLAIKFIDNRDFESLKDLILSNIYNYTKSMKSANPNPKYSTMDIDKVLSLYTEVDSYLSQLGVEQEESELINEIFKNK